jgi:hypothetical protein
MNQENRRPLAVPLNRPNTEPGLPAAWREFIRFCRDLNHGEIERLSIQDGLPVLAETTKKKVKFS